MLAYLLVGCTVREVRYNKFPLCANNAQTKLANHLVEEVNRLKLETPHGGRTAPPPTEHDAAAAQEEWLKVPNHPPIPPHECPQPILPAPKLPAPSCPNSSPLSLLLG